MSGILIMGPTRTRYITLWVFLITILLLHPPRVAFSNTENQEDKIIDKGAIHYSEKLNSSFNILYEVNFIIMYTGI